MPDLAAPSITRSVAVWCGVTLASVGLAWLAVPELAVARGPAPSPESFDHWLRLGSALAAAGCAAWGWTVGTLVVTRAARGRTVTPRGCPAVLHRLLLGGLGVSLAAGLAVPAYAADGRPVTWGTTDGPARPLTSLSWLAGLPLPDRAVSAQAAPRRQPPGEAVVAPGDTLWDLAAAGLGHDASTADIAARCRLLHAVNRAVIGEDPDLITPGLLLRVPGARPDPR